MSGRAESNDSGAGSLLIVSLVGAIVALTVVALPSYAGLAVRQALVAAADSAALAAADAASGAVAGIPCDRARRVSTANEARLDACAVDGYVVTVAVSRLILGVRVSATATAGPPGSAG